MFKFENSVFSCRKYVFVNDFNVVRKVPKNKERIGPWPLCIGFRYASPTKACLGENGISQITNHSVSTLHCTEGTKKPKLKKKKISTLSLHLSINTVFGRRTVSNKIRNLVLYEPGLFT